MPFPRKLPEQILDAGTLLAQLWLTNKDEDSAYSDNYYFLVVTEDRRFRIFYGDRFRHGRTEYGFLHGDRKSCEAAFDDLHGWLVSWKKYCYVAGVTFWGDTEDGKVLAKLFLDMFPDLEEFVRIEHRKLDSANPKVKREILPRSDWMAIHYPQHVAA